MSGARRGDGQPGECHKLERVPSWPQETRPAWSNLRRQRRSSWAQAGHHRSAARSLLAALLCAFLRNAFDYLPRKVADDCLIELRWLYDRRNAEEARRDLAAWLLR